MSSSTSLLVLLIVAVVLSVPVLSMQKGGCGTKHDNSREQREPSEWHKSMSKRFPQADIPLWQACDSSSNPSVCNNPEVRDTFSLPPAQPVRYYVHVYITREDDGSNPIVSDEDVESKFEYYQDSLNDAFYEAGFQFVYWIVHVDDSELRHRNVDQYTSEDIRQFKIDVWNKIDGSDKDAMPYRAIRIYLTDDMGYQLGSATFSTFTDVLLPTGGMILVPGAMMSTDENTLPHEMGHIFGLEHPFFSTDNEDACDYCWVKDHPNSDKINLDQTGDYCSDTPWSGNVDNYYFTMDQDCTGYYWTCPLSEDLGPCTDSATCGFDITHPPSEVDELAANYMSYYECDGQQFFSEQQKNRMRCFAFGYLQDAKDIPTTWTCDKSAYNAQDKCDCNCGVYDPDCAYAGLESSCSNNEACNQYTVTCEEIPSEWTCFNNYWFDDQCDCDCGFPDPTCEDTTLRVFGCPTSDYTCDAGVCTEPAATEPAPAPIGCQKPKRVKGMKVKHNEDGIKVVFEPSVGAECYKIQIREEDTKEWKTIEKCTTDLKVKWPKSKLTKKFGPFADYETFPFEVAVKSICGDVKSNSKKKVSKWNGN
eukprot:TRINITY_DN14882_c0_g1_i1.p1 TRINITY_DN14882_c0_g1~~TRINITY_DN14882_c0_g1_i1.p1  ORF type:complete len:590 (+),score=138.68 TRINITY_DN14882_c0_g1_i1:96-1865(+)